MTKNRKIFLVALVGFIASFFVPAVHDPSFDGNLSGALCAWLTFVLPWDKFLREFAFNTSSAYLAFLLSGFINPLSLAAVVLLQKRQYRLGKLLRIIVISLLPACWLALWKQHAYPTIGYFLWAASMIVALFTASSKAQADLVQPKSSEPEKLGDISTSTTFLLLNTAKSANAS